MRPSLTLTSRRLIHLRSPLGLPVLRLVPVACMPFAITPAGPMKPVRSHCSIGIGLPRSTGGSAPAFAISRPAQRLLVLRPARSLGRHCDLFHRRLQRLRYLHHCFDCYRVERTSSREGLPPSVDQRLFTAHCRLPDYAAYFVLDSLGHGARARDVGIIRVLRGRRATRRLVDSGWVRPPRASSLPSLVP